MSAGAAVKSSIVNATMGVIIGAVIETIVPPYDASSSDATKAFEATVQVALNGVGLTMLAGVLASDDPTYGFPFAVGLLDAQPQLAKRLADLASLVKSLLTQGALRMAAPARVEDMASQST
jgi:hypothetical protein